MSDEKVGGLVELPKPIRAMVRFTALQHIERDVYTAEQLHAYADARVEAALSAHGQPVVDEVWLRQAIEEFKYLSGRTDLPMQDRERWRALNAALGDTP